MSANLLAPPTVPALQTRPASPTLIALRARDVRPKVRTLGNPNTAAHLDGRAANYSPDSPDTPVLAEAMWRLQEVPCLNVPVRQAKQRCTDIAELFVGNRILYTEWTHTIGAVRFSAPLSLRCLISAWM